MDDQRLGYLYMAKRPCGKVGGMCWDDQGAEKETAKWVASFIRRGYSVDRVERFKGDAAPEIICRPKCRDCIQPNSGEGE
jgi:hypothetical protein